MPYRPFASGDGRELHETVYGHLRTGWEQFEEWLSHAIDPYVLTNHNGDIIGFGFMDYVFRGYWGSVHIAGLRRRDAGAYVGAIIASRRVAREWMNKWDLHKLIAAIPVSDAFTQRLSQAIGMSKDGVFRDHIKVDGLWCDCEMWSLLENELMET